MQYLLNSMAHGRFKYKKCIDNSPIGDILVVDRDNGTIEGVNPPQKGVWMYKVEITNTKTGKRMIAQPTFASKRKAEAWAEAFKASMRNSDAKVVKG